MKEYIDREALIRSIITDRWQHGLNDQYVAEGIAYALHKITKAPAADVVEVVRCKDCKHNVANWNHSDPLDITDYTDITCDYHMTDGMRPNDFCSCGERKE